MSRLFDIVFGDEKINFFESNYIIGIKSYRKYYIINLGILFF